jgi:lipopolysaccharide export system protein LptA
MCTSPTRIERLSRHAFFLGACAGLILAAGTPVQAAPNDQKPVPIHIHSDDAAFDQDTGKSTYTGNVHMVRAGLTLTGNKLVVTQPQNAERIKAVLTGDPAHIDKQPDASGNQVITGHAQKIVYTNGNALITLSGDAVVNRAGDQVKAPVVTYNLKTEMTHAKGGKSQNKRVHITILPKDHD